MLNLGWCLGRGQRTADSANEAEYDVLGSLLVTPTGKSALKAMDNPYLPSSEPPHAF